MDEIGLHYAVQDFYRGAEWDAADASFQAAILDLRRGMTLLTHRKPETLEQAVARRRAVIL